MKYIFLSLLILPHLIFAKTNTDLIDAVEKADIKKVEELLIKGSDPNAKNRLGKVALHYASKRGDVKIARLLLKHGADVNASSELDLTSLFYAVENGHTKMIELLLKNQANVHAVDGSEKTPLYYVLNKKSAELLLKYGANVHAQDTLNRTPLDYAKLNKRKEVVESLLKNGASESVKNTQGKASQFFSNSKIVTKCQQAFKKTSKISNWFKNLFQNR